MHIELIDTPAAIVDLDQLEANIIKLQTYLDEHGIANRPHIKTHKIPAIARMQIDAGASGITCQKIGEAEVMAQAGIEDIFLPYNIVGRSKLDRLMTLARQTQLSITADSEYVVKGLAKAAARHGVTLKVLVECDTGANRCGVQSSEEAVVLAKKIDSADGLEFGGLMTYPSSEQANEFMKTTRRLLTDVGLQAERISGGGTPVIWKAHQYPEITEHRAGMYIYGDRYTLKSGAMEVEDCALHVLATVVSRPAEDRGILDSGSKTLSSDMGERFGGHGLILEYPDAVIYNLSEEHGHVDFSKCRSKPNIGDRVTIIPNHCCPISNLFNQIIGVRDNRVKVVWEVAARGKLQ